MKDKHPSCGFLTCCAIKDGLEVCSECKDYPCSRFDSELKGYDSFVTHQKVFDNLNSIKSKGIDFFIENQKERIDILNDLLGNFDDGRSKSFFCICSALLPLENLQQAHQEMHQLIDSIGIKEKNKRIKDHFQTVAINKSIDLRLNKKRK